VASQQERSVGGPDIGLAVKLFCNARAAEELPAPTGAGRATSSSEPHRGYRSRDRRRRDPGLSVAVWLVEVAPRLSSPTRSSYAQDLAVPLPLNHNMLCVARPEVSESRT
jgi:hypothetical protein